MQPLLYHDIVSWYRLVDPPEDHRDEAATFQAGFERAIEALPDQPTLLELGAGAGHNALHLKRRFRCTLTDVSPGMQVLSRELNPECEHVPGDMRTLRLGRVFDAVLVHDAVTYMTTKADLLAAVRTAFAHTRAGGAAIFAPDDFKDAFRERTSLITGDDGARGLRCIEWIWDPDQQDDTAVSEFAFLLREGDAVRAVHDRHLHGLFTKLTWRRLLGGSGFEVEMLARPIGEGESDDVFVCRRPADPAGDGVHFRPLEEADLSLLHVWLNRPHVADIWDGPMELREVEEEYGGYLRSPTIFPFIACVGGRPVGYIQIYEDSASAEPWYSRAGDDVWGIDQFIGEPELLGRGIGTEMVRAFVRLAFERFAPARIVTDPSPDNARAIRCYEKAGFRPVGVVDSPDGPALLMQREE